MNDFHPPAILEHKCYQQSVTIITKDLCVFVRVSSHHIEVGEAASDGPKNWSSLHRLHLRCTPESINHTHTHTNVNQSLPLTKLCCSLFLSSMILLYCCLPNMIVWIIHHVCLFNDPHTKQTTVSYRSLPCPQQDTAAANEGLTRLTSPDLTKAQVGAVAIGCTDDGAEPMRCGGWRKSRYWMKVEDKWTSGETRW